MRYDYLHTGKALNDAIKKSYRAGIASVIRLNKKTILKFADEPRKLFEVDYSLRDLAALQNFRVEAFTVAGVGLYELEERLKELAIEIQKSDKLSDPLKEFENRSREIMNDYVWTEGQPPGGWLRTNLQTAVTSSYRAAEWNRITDPDLAGLYSYLQYKTVADDRVREQHQILHDRIFPTGDEIWDNIYPPNGWNCRCYVNPMTNEDVPADQGGIAGVEERKQLLKEAGVHKDFARNPGKTSSIWDKWLSSILKEIDLEKLFASIREYSGSGISSNFIITQDKIAQIRSALDSGQISKQTADYDNNKFLSLEDDRIRKYLDPVFNAPDEVWGRTFKSSEGMISEIYYIKYTAEGIAVSVVRAGKLADIRGVKIDDLNKYRKGILMHKNFN